MKTIEKMVDDDLIALKKKQSITYLNKTLLRTEI